MSIASTSASASASASHSRRHRRPICPVCRLGVGGDVEVNLRDCRQCGASAHAGCVRQEEEGRRRWRRRRMRRGEDEEEEEETEADGNSDRTAWTCACCRLATVEPETSATAVPPRRDRRRKRRREADGEANARLAKAAARHSERRECQLCNRALSGLSARAGECRLHEYHAACLLRHANASDAPIESLKCPGSDCDVAFDVVDYDGRQFRLSQLVCAVCRCLSTELLARPDTCEHSFCFRCLWNWSARSRTCPMDRRPFRQMLVSRVLDKGMRFFLHPAPMLLSDEDDDEDDDLLQFNCIVCGLGSAADRMVICQHCDASFHIDCLPDPLPRVPLSAWLCLQCRHYLR